MINKDEISDAISAHGMWKQRLRQAIVSGSSEYTVNTLKVDNLCAFGKWLHSLAPDEKKSTHWVNVKDLHATFHVEAASILDLALKGKKKEAEDAMEAGKEFARLSGKLTVAMMSWKGSLA
jgi:Chemoreceptor zinc-binding domain